MTRLFQYCRRRLHSLTGFNIPSSSLDSYNFLDASKKVVLSKSLLVSHNRCPRKAFLDVKLTKRESEIDPSLRFVYYIGNHIQKYAKFIYGDGVDLTGNRDMENVLQATRDAIADENTTVIYEAGFLWNNIYIRADVLLRDGDSWKMIEIKSGSSINDRHILDVSIQNMVIKNSRVAKLDSCYIATLNKDFLFDGMSYADLLHLEKIGENSEAGERLALLNPREVEELIQQTSTTLERETPPDTKPDSQCKNPYPCIHKSICIETKAEVPISILPHVGNHMAAEWAKQHIYDLREIPRESIKKDMHKRIWDCHYHNSIWKNPKIAKKLSALPWPRYSMDFETIQQMVPIIPGTTPRQVIPFQWSVHRWDSLSHKVALEDGFSFLQYVGTDLHVNFLTSLVKVLGTSGPIFVHNITTERGILQKLIARPDCQHLSHEVNAIIKRLSDTLPLCRDNFYAPALRGSYSLKNIVKGIPTTISYQDEESGVNSGLDAQLMWFQYNDHSVTEEQKRTNEESLLRYCAKDTLALLDLVRYLSTDEEQHPTAE